MRGEQIPAGPGGDQPPSHSNITIHTGHSSKDLPPQPCSLGTGPRLGSGSQPHALG